MIPPMGENPIEVSIGTPFLIAVSDEPQPRWQDIILSWDIFLNFFTRREKNETRPIKEKSRNQLFLTILRLNFSNQKNKLKLKKRHFLS